MDEDLTKKSRAELLELCKAKGLKASGWKKDKMLEALTGGTGEVEAPVAGVGQTLAPERVEELTEASQSSEVALDAEEPADATSGTQSDTDRRSGWCMVHWPLWTVHHLRCRAREQYGRMIDCACPCHADGWVQPPMPEGAKESKFETPETRAAALSGAEVEQKRLAKEAENQALQESVKEPTPVEMPADEVPSAAGEIAAAISANLETGADYQDAVAAAVGQDIMSVPDEVFAAADAQSMATGESIASILTAAQEPVLAPLDPALEPWLAWARTVPGAEARRAQYQASGVTAEQSAAVEQHLAAGGA